METYKYWVLGLPFWIAFLIKDYKDTGNINWFVLVVIFMAIYGIKMWRDEHMINKEKEKHWKEIKEMIDWL